MTALQLPPGLKGLRAAPIFVVGSPRSGTTYVLEVLSTHPEVAGIFESQLFTVEHGFGSLFAPYNWAGERTRGGLTNLVDRATVADAVRQLTGEWLGRKLAPNQHYLVEKTPGHLWTLDVIDEVYPEARVIHVVRDGRDVAVSVLAAANSWSPGWKDRAGRSYGAAAANWRAAMATCRDSASRLGPRYYEVHYEDLRADPIAQYRKLFAFAEIPVDEPDLERIVAANDFEKVKWKSHDSFRRSAKVGEWSGRLSLLDAALVHRAAGQLLLEGNFEDDPRWWLHQRPKMRDAAGLARLLAGAARRRLRS